MPFFHITWFGTKFDYAYLNLKKNITMYFEKIKKVEGGYEILVLLPGVDKKEITIELKNKNLVVTCESKNDFVNYQGAVASFSLSEELDTQNITSEYKNGILKITVPEKAESKKTIEVK